MCTACIIGVCDHLLDPFGGELLQYHWVHDLLLAWLRGRPQDQAVLRPSRTPLTGIS